MPSAEAFWRGHVQASLPLVVRGGVRDWSALKWSADYFRQWPDETVRVAPLQAHGPHAFWDKWLEPAVHWQHAEPTPDVVRDDTLLVVSAKRVVMPLRRFCALLQPAHSAVAAGFYADGASNLEHSFGFLSADIGAQPLAETLALKRVDLWLGFRSVSRMHYDNLDNLFSQLVGSKTFVLANPAAGAALVRRRLRKAARAYEHPGVFSREGGGVTDETVLNYLPCERPPSLPTVSVTLAPGDVLYLPFGWWHEVHAHPDEARGLCASASHFCHPYWCRLGGKATTGLGDMLVNPRYRSAGVEGLRGVSDDGGGGGAGEPAAGEPG